MNPQFNNVHLACLWKKNVEILNDVEINKYRDFIKRFPVPVESVAEEGRQTKPYLDADPIKSLDYTDEDWNADILKNKQTILARFVDTNICISDIYAIKRKYQVDDGVKFSVHYMVDKIRMSACNMAKLFEAIDIEGFDKSVYSKNRFLTSIYTNKKIVDKKEKTITMFMPDADAHITKYLVSYIEEDFENYDLQFPPPKKISIIEQIDEACSRLKVKGNSIIMDDDNDDDINDYDIEKSKKYIKKICSDLDPKRLFDYSEWINVMFAIINICRNKKVNVHDCRQLLHEVSKTSRNYDEVSVEKWININYDKVEMNKKGLGINYLINTCIKTDNYALWCEEYEKPSYNVMKSRFEKHCFFCLNNIIYIDINEDRDEINQDVFYILNQKDIKKKYGHLTFYSRNVDKKGVWNIKTESFINKWITDPKLKKYQSLCFIPKEIDDIYKGKHFNLFSGFKAALKPVKKNYYIIQPFLNHIKDVLVNGNEEHYNWIMQYFANIVQNPDKKSSVIIIFQGTQGAGKSIVVDTFYKNIIGDDFAASTSSPDRDFFGNFNSKLCNKVFSVINEAGNELRGCMDKIKDLSVSPSINIEKKGKDPITFANYNNFIGTTNNMNPLDIAWDDRRFAWFKVSPKYITNEKYFDALGSCIEHEDFDSSLYHYLKEEVKINITNFQKTRPQTQEYEDIKKRNLPNVLKFLTDIYKGFEYRKGRTDNIECAYIDKNIFYAQYKEYCDTCKYTAYNYTAFKAYMQNIVGVSEVKSHGMAKYRFIKDEFEPYIKEYDDDDNLEDVGLDDIDE